MKGQCIQLNIISLCTQNPSFNSFCVRSIFCFLFDISGYLPLSITCMSSFQFFFGGGGGAVGGGGWRLLLALQQ